jgi:ATP-dependent Clp protease protease subunit
MIQMEEMVKLNDKLTELYVKHNSKGKTIEDFKQAMARDYWLSAEEAIEFGLVDSIMTSRKDLPI